MAVVAPTANYHSAPLIPGQRKTYVMHKKGTPNKTNFPISENMNGQKKLHKQMNIRAEENLTMANAQVLLEVGPHRTLPKEHSVK